MNDAQQPARRRVPRARIAAPNARTGSRRPRRVHIDEQTRASIAAQQEALRKRFNPFKSLKDARNQLDFSSLNLDIEVRGFVPHARSGHQSLLLETPPGMQVLTVVNREYYVPMPWTYYTVLVRDLYDFEGQHPNPPVVSTIGQSRAQITAKTKIMFSSWQANIGGSTHVCHNGLSSWSMQDLKTAELRLAGAINAWLMGNSNGDYRMDHPFWVKLFEKYGDIDKLRSTRVSAATGRDDTKFKKGYKLWSERSVKEILDKDIWRGWRDYQKVMNSYRPQRQLHHLYAHRLDLSKCEILTPTMKNSPNRVAAKKLLKK